MIGDKTNSYAYQNSVRYFQIASLKQQAYAILFSYRVQNYSKLSNCANLETSTKGFLKFFRIDNYLNINDITGQSENSVAILLSGYSFVSLRHETMASITDSIS